MHLIVIGSLNFSQFFLAFVSARVRIWFGCLEFGVWCLCSMFGVRCSLLAVWFTFNFWRLPNRQTIYSKCRRQFTFRIQFWIQIRIWLRIWGATLAQWQRQKLMAGHLPQIKPRSSHSEPVRGKARGLASLCRLNRFDSRQESGVAGESASAGNWLWFVVLMVVRINQQQMQFPRPCQPQRRQPLPLRVELRSGRAVERALMLREKVKSREIALIGAKTKVRKLKIMSKFELVAEEKQFAARQNNAIAKMNFSYQLLRPLWLLWLQRRETLFTFANEADDVRGLTQFRH